MLESALKYCQMGFSVIPVRADKKPLISWQEYTKRRATPEEIKAWWQKWPQAMIGIVTGKISGLFVIDCDTQAGFDAIQALLPDSLVLPISRTPRGGWHLYFKYPENSTLTIAAGIMPGVDYRGESGYVVAPPSRNEKGAYAWQAGLLIFEDTLPSLPQAVLNKFKNNIPYRGGEVTFENATPLNNGFLREGRRDQDLFHTANCLVKGGCEIPIVGKILNILSRNCDPPFPQNEIQAKIQSALQRAEKREINFSEEVTDFVLTSSGVFLTSDVYNRLQVTSRQDRKNIVTALLRLKDRGIIERTGTRDGCYRRIDTEADDIDFVNVADNGLDVKWPFAIERFVKILPKNIVVIAGSPNAGKTAFLLNLINLNQQKHKIIYFSSEMGALELHNRLAKFGFPLDSWNFRAVERSSNFADVIDPDAINIIDFLELHADFWQVGGMIKNIYDKIKTGLAVIALQKNPGTDFGLGGQRSVEKARLYLSMDQNKLSIQKAKNWASTENPNNMTVRFKLIDGCRFMKQGDWTRKED